MMTINMIATKRVEIAEVVEAVVTTNTPGESQLADGGVEKTEGPDPRAEDHQGTPQMHRKVVISR